MRPRCAPTARDREKRLGFSTVLTYISEERAPIPGTVISRRQIGSALTCCSTALSKTAICWRSCRHVASRGRTTPCCTGRRCWRIEPYPCCGLCGADVLRAPEVQHPVQNVAGDGYLGRLSPIRLRAQPATNDAFPARDIGFHESAPVIP